MEHSFAERKFMLERIQAKKQTQTQKGGFILGAIGLTLLANRILKLRPKNVRKLLKKHGHKNIKRIVVSRVPINSVVKGILNALTLGGLSNAQKELSYDEVYHLYANLYLEDGTVIGIEKNQRVAVAIGGYPISKSSQSANDLNINLKDLFSKAEAKAKGNLWQYSGYKYNCQHFINTLLVESGVKHLTSFIMQDAGQLIKNSFIRNVAKFTTDIAGVTEFGLKGGGNELPWITLV